MGRLDVTASLGAEGFRAFTKALLTDLRALERMIDAGAIEAGRSRIGFEQELFLVTPAMRPAPLAMDVLGGLDAAVFTTELGLFNVEANLPPMALGGACLSQLERAVDEAVGAVRERAAALGADVALMGILPTLTKSDLSLAWMTPLDRYRALNAALSRMCGATYHLHIQGTDELHLEHDSVMLEAATNGIHVHIQVEPSTFAHTYNAAQLVAAPVLAAAVNSPLLFHRLLWKETRVALFQQALDTRGTTKHIRELTPRVRFGERWVQASVLEMFMEDLSRIPALLAASELEDPFAVLEAGGTPELQALQIYNSTVYRWNRPCYGRTDGRGHLRIEARYLPSGPTIRDEVANAAFWIGSVLGMADRAPDLADRLDFAEARANFVAAARRGLDAGFGWLDDRPVAAARLILDELLPIAHEGLERAGVAPGDRTDYLGTIEARVGTRRTGARWLVDSFHRLGRSGTVAERMAALTAASVSRARANSPVHEWDLATLGDAGGWRQNYMRVEQFMTTDLFTVHEDELVDLAAFLMDWKRVRQVPVEDDEHHLVGLVTYGAVLRLLIDGRLTPGETVPVRDIMERNPVTIGPDASTLDAIRLMRDKRLTCLPVVQDDLLIGIVTIGDFVPIAERLLEEQADFATP